MFGASALGRLALGMCTIVLQHRPLSHLVGFWAEGAWLPKARPEHSALPLPAAMPSSAASRASRSAAGGKKTSAGSKAGGGKKNPKQQAEGEASC